MASRTLEDREMIVNEDRWPCWPILPVKRYTGQKPSDWPVCGILIAGQVSAVYHLSMFEVSPEKLKECEKTEYPDVDAMLAAGWIVD